MTFAWMAWTPATAIFFVFIALVLTCMGVLTRLMPRNAPRRGVLGLATQRGDRLFLSLLGSAFIHLAWLGLTPDDAPLWGASVLSVVYAGLVFRFV
jgi:predicted small integral membrane protein